MALARIQPAGRGNYSQLSNCETASSAPYPLLALPVTKDIGILQQVQQRSINMVRSLDHDQESLCEKTLRELGQFRLKQRLLEVWGEVYTCVSLLSSNKPYQKVEHKMDGAKLPSGMHGDRIRVNKYKLQHGKFQLRKKIKIKTYIHTLSLPT